MTSKYRDFYVDFNVHPIRGDLAVQEDAAAISTSIKNLMFTGRYERPWSPSLGAGIPQTLFENMNSDTEFMLETRIKEVIKAYEPRATRVKVQVVASSDSNRYNATIYYTPINSLSEVTLEAIFKRIR